MDLIDTALISLLYSRSRVAGQPCSQSLKTFGGQDRDAHACKCYLGYGFRPLLFCAAPHIMLPNHLQSLNGLSLDLGPFTVPATVQTKLSGISRTPKGEYISQS